MNDRAEVERLILARLDELLKRDNEIIDGQRTHAEAIAELRDHLDEIDREVLRPFGDGSRPPRRRPR